MWNPSVFNAIMTAVGGFLGHLPRPMDTFRDDSRTLAAKLYEQFIRCEKQQLAADTITHRVLDVDFEWKTEIGKKLFSVNTSVDDHTHQLWQFFVQKLVEQILLYGFALYRVETIPQNKQNDLTEARPSKKARKQIPTQSRYVPRVAHGQGISVQWDEETYSWHFMGDSGAEMLSKDGWQLIMFKEPRVVKASNTILYASASANAYEQSVKYKTLVENVVQRDNTNSKINVLTQFSKNFGTMPGSTKSFLLPAAQAGMMSIPKSLFNDADEAIRNRAQAAIEIANSTQRMRANTLKAYQAHSNGRRNDENTRQQLLRPMEHREHLVTDAQEGKQVAPLKAPENIENMIERCENGILFSYQIPPQALGKNINSERIAASNRLAESAIERYETMIKKLRELIQIALKHCSLEISKHFTDAKVYVFMKPCIGEYALSTLQPILKTESAARLTSCVHSIPFEEIDMTRLKKQQDLALDPKGALLPAAGQSKPGPSGAAGSKSEAERDRSRQRNRPEQTTAQKSANMRAKNMP